MVGRVIRWYENGQPRAQQAGGAGLRPAFFGSLRRDKEPADLRGRGNLLGERSSWQAGALPIGFDQRMRPGEIAKAGGTGRNNNGDPRGRQKRTTFRRIPRETDSRCYENHIPQTFFRAGKRLRGDAENQRFSAARKVQRRGKRSRKQQRRPWQVAPNNFCQDLTESEAVV